MYLDDDENKITGTIGAVIGAALAVGLWCLIGVFGKIAVIGGFALCLGTLGGYFLLGKGMSKTGLIICLAVIVISVYLATRLVYGITLYRQLDGSVSFGDCFDSVLKLLRAMGEIGAFYKDLVFGYLITIGGGAALLFKLGALE